MIELRILDPVTDIKFFREAYNWRTRPKKHIQPDRASFQTFTSTDPRQIVIGVFNGQFCAAFLLYEYEPGRFEAHFTSRRGTAKETLVEGGVMIRDAFLKNGAVELCAWITERNKGLRTYLEALGFQEDSQKEIDGRRFVRYIRV